MILKALTLKDKYVEAVFERELIADDQHPDAYLQEIWSFCRENSCYRVLIDQSAALYPLSIMEQHLFGLFVATRFPGGKTKIAVITSKHAEHQTHLEAVTWHRGMDLRVFWDRAEVLVWLLAD